MLLRAGAGDAGVCEGSQGALGIRRLESEVWTLLLAWCAEKS